MKPTNCDPCKPWIPDIAVQAAKGGMRPYGWAAPEDPPPFATLSKSLSQCKIGTVFFFYVSFYQLVLF
jgi:hypothetical protein